VPERGQIVIIRQQTPAKLVRKNRPKTFRFPACFCVSGSLGKPPPSASRAPHRDDFPNDLNDLLGADPIVLFIVQ